MLPRFVAVLPLAVILEGCCTCPPQLQGSAPPSVVASAPNVISAPTGSTPIDSGSDVPSTSQQGRYFRSASWNDQIGEASVDPQSKRIIAAIDAAGGWGTGIMRIDFSIHVFQADGETPMRTFEKTDDFYSPDCDYVPVPVPHDGAVEGETSYECSNDGDCHLIVVRTDTNTLYEMWRTNMAGETLYGGCLAVWDLSRDYEPAMRGEQCTSADAAGLPIAPLLFTPAEVASGEITHAIRFILPNDRIRHRRYAAPASHATTAAASDAGPPYGARLRLRADFPVESLPTEGAKTVARALQKYGMVLADGGNIALTAQSDRGSTVKWDGLLGSRDLKALKVADFEVVELGPVKSWSGDCRR